ncbi:DUF2635 domain-containing protein [Caballeronia sp. BR00000012568055]|uniref:DUF2635 domain-containing protein n=1 Tax=Caballeronia sp. BR00000012568055 TaxID=2918761 RepID=UPI0023F6A819|nr:DUF2635 domain-containing protein [Caballeronia sp. BR00000012568055]
MQTLRIRPVAGRVVRDPDLHDLITAPRTVPQSPFWRRRVRDGDVAVDDTPAPANESANADAYKPAQDAPQPKPTRSTARTNQGGTP